MDTEHVFFLPQATIISLGNTLAADAWKLSLRNTCPHADSEYHTANTTPSLLFSTSNFSQSARMVKKQAQPGAAPATPGAAASPAPKPARSASTSGSATANLKNATDAQAIVQGVWSKYLEQTPQRVKLIDTFLAFLVAVGALQFVYCVLAGNYVS